ncbi:hypothetical protein KKC13_10750 [bacterium]|nr:hypothetical protein [bacterium]MBU1959176.1 hypothetical protein [bacterium]
MTQNYKTYQKTLKTTFSKIPLIFQENNYLPTEDIYIELALSDYSTDVVTIFHTTSS